MSYYQFKYTAETLAEDCIGEELSRRVLGQEEGDEVVLVAEKVLLMVRATADQHLE